MELSIAVESEYLNSEDVNANKEFEISKKVIPIELILDIENILNKFLLSSV